MTWNEGVRRTHRVVSVIFTAAVVVNLVAAGQEEPAMWVGLLALVPLIVLQLTGLYLLVLPYTSRWRRGQRDELPT